MSPPVMLAVAVAVFLLAVAAIRVWAHRSRAQPESPVNRGGGAGPRVAIDEERPVGPAAASPQRTERR